MPEWKKVAFRSRTGAWAGLAVVGLGAVLGYLVWTGAIAGGQPVCEVCRRELHPGAGFTIAGPDGARQRTCCPRCGLRVVIQRGGKALEAVDFQTGKAIPAADAVYVEGSDIMECCSGSGFRTDEGTYSDIQYDRCLPTLVAFARREDAAAAAREHGGRVIGFEEARQSVARQLQR
jgi:hypothetical protein